MVKKILVITITILSLIILALWSPWSTWDFSIFSAIGLKQEDPYAGLQVYSISGEIQVLVDNEVVGNVTVEGSPLDIFEIEPGDHLITIKRVKDDESSEAIYYELNRMVSFVEGINTVVAYELGPNENFSGGYIIYVTDSISEENSFLNVSSDALNAQISINDNTLADLPLSNYALDYSDSYELRINAEGFESIEFNLLPEDDTQRKRLTNYDINVEANLFELPIEIVETDE